MITMTGIKLLIKDELSARNMTIVGLSLALSLGIAQVPEAIAQLPTWIQSVIGGSPIVVAAITAFSLNLLLPRVTLADEERERELMARTDDSADCSPFKPASPHFAPIGRKARLVTPAAAETGSAPGAEPSFPRDASCAPSRATRSKK